MREPLICAPLRIEATALQSGLSGGRVIRIGPGRKRAQRAARSPRLGGAGGIAVAGIAGALSRELRPGDVVVADRVSTVDGAAGSAVGFDVPSAPLLAARLREGGLTVHVGGLVSADHLVTGGERAALGSTGALAVDMETAWVLGGAGQPVAAVRVVADIADEPLVHPRTLDRIRRAVAVLPRLAPALEAWGAALGRRTVLLAGPRSFCAGVERAISIVELALEQRGAPVYVRKQIVHNVHVVQELHQRGAVFVEELDEVPDGASVVFSAHGVAPEVRDAAQARGLDVIDATCPLVSKVHSEVRRFADRGDTVIFIGHAGHEETVGTMDERSAHTVLVQDAADAARVRVPDAERVAYLVQTTLSADEVAGIVDILRQRFPALRAPASDDICYATTNRQQALQAVATDSDVVLVVGSQNSSNSQRLVEAAERLGRPAYLVDDVHGVHLDWLAGAATVGLTAGASAPSSLVDEVIDALRGLGPVEVRQRQVVSENVHFTLPKEVRPA